MPRIPLGRYYKVLNVNEMWKRTGPRPPHTHPGFLGCLEGDRSHAESDFSQRSGYIMPSVFNDVLYVCARMTDLVNIGSTAKEGFSEVKLGLNDVIQLSGALHRHVLGACELWFHLGATIISKPLEISIS